MQGVIKVNYKTYSTIYSIRKILLEIEAKFDTVSFDLETRSMYTKAQRDIAEIALKHGGLDIEKENEYTRIAKSSGLSHPSLLEVTHIILGLTPESSVIFIVDEITEMLVFNWLVRTNMRILIHNASFDLKIVHHRTGRFPKNFEDTQLLAKTLINDCNNYHSRTGLKLLVGSHYPPKWSIKEEVDYEVKDYKDKHFLEYCAIDGGAVHLLWNILQEVKEND